MKTLLQITKCTKSKAHVNVLLTLLLSLVLTEAHSANGLPSQALKYDPNSDELSVTVEQGSLKAVLSRIAILSGIEVLMDPRVEQQISVAIEKQPLESGLKQLVRGMNSVFRYDNAETENSKPLLVGLNLLPRSDADESMLQPVLDIEGEAMLRTMTQRSQATENKLVVQRWEQRLEQLPADYREHIVNVAQEQRRKLEERREFRKLRQQQSELKRLEVLAERDRVDEFLRLEDPERYELRLQRIKEIEQSVRYN